MAAVRLTIEVPVFLFFFSIMLGASIYTNLIIFRTCYVSLGYNETECALLGRVYNNETEKLETIVQPRAAVINMVRSTTESVVSLLLGLFIGSWSDRFGRKPMILVNLLGFSLSFFLVAIFSYFSKLSPWFSVIGSIPIFFSGGLVSFLTIVLAYITDVSTEENRGVRMAIFEAVLAGGLLLGNITSSYLFYATSYVWVFTVAGGLNTLGLIYTLFFVPESMQNPETQGKIKGFFDILNFVDMVKTTFKKRPHYIRAIILLNVIILTAAFFIVEGEGGVMFLYVREKFHWTLTKFTLFGSVAGVISIVGTIAATYIFHKFLKIREANLVLVGIVSSLISSLLQGFATRDGFLYAAAVVRCLGGLKSPMSRSLISKLVPDKEIGKIFSVLMSTEYLFGLGASPLYTLLYNATIKTNASIFNFLTAGLLGISVVATIAIILLQRNSRNYSKLDNEDEEISGSNHAIN